MLSSKTWLFGIVAGFAIAAAAQATPVVSRGEDGLVIDLPANQRAQGDAVFARGSGANDPTLIFGLPSLGGLGGRAGGEIPIPDVGPLLNIDQVGQGGAATGGIASTTAVAVVPEPASLALFGAGLLGLGIAARRRSATVY